MAFALADGMKAFAQQNRWILFVSFIISISSILTLSCCGDFRRKFPHNFICLGIFTVAQSIPLGMVSALMDTKIVFLAILITAIICVSLTAFAFQTKIDFTLYSGAAFMGLVVFFMFGLLLSILGTSQITQIVYSSLGAFLFGEF